MRPVKNEIEIKTLRKMTPLLDRDFDQNDLWLTDMMQPYNGERILN